jgi:hypothetical protein
MDVLPSEPGAPEGEYRSGAVDLLGILGYGALAAFDRDALTSLISGTVDRPGLDLASISRMFTRLVENHTRRMASLGLQA